jgi:hypothetical protein
VLGPWEQAVSNWVYGGVASDDAHKGSEFGDQPEMEIIESYNSTPVLNHFNDKWRSVYGGIQRANDVLRVMRKATDLSPADTLQTSAEARFLRGVFHFEAVRMWGPMVPYVNENVNYVNANFNVPNDIDIYPQVEADLQYAATNLAPTNSQFGRATSWAAKAFLAKVYMAEHKYPEARTLLTDIINNGVNAAGVKYALVPNFSDNFNPTTQNNSETVYAVQMSVLDNAQGYNGNAGDVLNFPGGGPATCCGFYQPSFSLVNAYKTDATTGLPLFDTYNDTDLKNDQGITGTQSFTPGTESVDPRLDWTVGRRGIPYLDWGIHPGQTWIRAQAAAGPYSPKKNVYWKKDQNTTSDQYAGWAANQATANNYNMIRFADVLLMAAEAEVEAGSLGQAETYVNQVRARAANPSGFVFTYVNPSNPSGGFTTTPAANYRIGLFSGQFTANGQNYAREAVRFERRLELGMEGHRFFDLQRYDNGTGYMANILNAYIQHERSVPVFGPNYKILQNATFKQGQDEVFPIPQAQIDISNGTLKPNQNTGG